MNLRAALSKVGHSRWLPVVVMLVVGFSIAVVAIRPARAAVPFNTGVLNAGIDTIPVVGPLLPDVKGTTEIGGSIAEIIGHILMMLVSNFGKLLAVLIDIMVQIAAFNNFTKASAVQEGWEVARDLCNLLMVIVLLLIAWGTVLRVESYHYRRMLPKFILMAILVNFSKSIAGFLIDISQVIMMSFVNVIEGEVRQKLTTGVGLDTILQFKDNLDSVNFLEVGGALLLALILIALMMGAVIMLIFILLGRIIALWILVVLSPLAYLGETIGILKKAATTWWKMFGDYLVVGPLVAFFLWMAMLVIGSDPSSAGKQLAPGGAGSQRVVEAPASTTTGAGAFTATVSRISSSDNLLSFIVAVGMLFAASMAAQQFKTLGGGIGVAAYNKASNAASFIARTPVMAGGAANRAFGAKTGIDLNPVKNYQRVKESFAVGKKRQEEAVQLTAEKRAGQGGLRGLMANAAPSWASQYIGAGLGATVGRTWQGSMAGTKISSGRDKKFESDKRTAMVAKQAEINRLQNTLNTIPHNRANRAQRTALKDQVAQRKVELEELGKTTRQRTTGEVRYGPNDRAYQRLLQSKVAEEAKNLPATADELVEHRTAAEASGKNGMVTAMAANEKLMQLGRSDLVKGDHKDIILAIQAMGRKIGMSDDDALYHAGNMAAIGASKPGGEEFMNLITMKNGHPKVQDEAEHLKTVNEARAKNMPTNYRNGNTGGMTNKERADPNNPASPMLPVLNESAIAHLLSGGIGTLARSIEKKNLNPKFDFLANEKNMKILKEIAGMLKGKDKDDMNNVVLRHLEMLQKSRRPDFGQTITDAKDIKKRVP